MQTHKKQNIKIPKELRKRIVNYYNNSYKGVIPDNYSIEDFVKHRVDSAYTQIHRLKKLKITGKNVCLDAGGGVGLFTVLANLSGYNFYAYDLDKAAVNIAKDLFIANGISPHKVSLGDSNRLNKIKFDLITSFQVAEHVKDINGYLKKLRNIISPNGRLFIDTPNYQIPYEPHFYVFLPYGPKSIKWLVCRLYGRYNHAFFEELNFVTAGKIEQALKGTGFRIDNIGLKEWIEEIIDKPSKDRSIYVKTLSRFFRQFKISWVLKLFAKMGFYTPLRYLAYPKS